MALLWAVFQAAHGKITVSGISKCLNVIFIVYSQFAAGGMIRPGGPQVGDPCSTTYHNPSRKMVEQNLHISFKTFAAT
jgi:hypothetical protein